MESDPAHEKSEYELLREKNIREREALFASDEENEEFSNISEALKAVDDYSHAVKTPKTVRKQKRRSNRDASFTFSGHKPSERRRSSRLAKYDPEFSYQDLPDEQGSIRRSVLKDNDKNLFPGSKMKIKLGKRAPRVEKIVIDGSYRSKEITANDFANIAKSPGVKVYSSSGTTCHQCRQKTLDTKTFCRNSRCTGIHGQLCGPCLDKRYGQFVKDTLNDPTWICPYCLNYCNCSFCRIKRGKAPTGPLAHDAIKNGYKSVHHLLLALEGEEVESEEAESEEAESEETESKEAESKEAESKEADEESDEKRKKTIKELRGAIVADIEKIVPNKSSVKLALRKTEEKGLLGITSSGEYMFA